MHLVDALERDEQVAHVFRLALDLLGEIGSVHAHQPRIGLRRKRQLMCKRGSCAAPQVHFRLFDSSALRYLVNLEPTKDKKS